MIYRAAIFDLYGTLVDFLPSEEYRQCHLDIACVLGVSNEEMRETWRESFGNRYTGEFISHEECLAHVCRTLGREVLPEQIEEATRIRLDLIRRNLQPRDGAVKLLSVLKAAGYRLGLISDCVPEVTRVWNKTAFERLIDHAIFSPDAGVTKPAERIYRLACYRLGVLSEQCLYVGDGSSYELTGARRVGMHAVLIRADDRGGHVPQRPDAEGWDGPVVRHLCEVASLAGVANER